MTMRILFAGAAVLAALGGLHSPAQGQGFKPTRPVEAVVHTGPGGGSDVLARAVALMMEKEKLLPTDRAIVMARRMLYEAATAMQAGAEPPALDANKQRVRAAGVLLDRNVKPQEWAKLHLADGLNQPVYSI